MANTIRIKRSTTTAAPTSLSNAELAYSEASAKFFIGVGTGGAGGSASSILAIGGPGAYTTLDTTQTVTGDKSFSGSVTLGSSAVATTPLTADNSTSVATTAYVKAQSYLTGNENISVSGDASGSGTTSINLTLAATGTAGTYTKVTTDSKGRVTSGTALSATDIPSLTAAKISDFDTQVRTSRLDQMAVPTADVSLNNTKITSLADPVSAQDAATKAYVDATKQGLEVKDSVRVATTANITLSGTQTIDGVAVIAGDRVLVKDQTTGSQNGLYVVAAGAWARSADADTSAKVNAGLFTFVEEGTANADSGWVLTTNNPITLATTSLAFTQFSGAGQITAGAGLTKTGNTLDVVGTADRILVNADSIDIASTYVGQTSITTLGTVGTGTWNGSVIGGTYGGTGVNNGSNTITLGGNLTTSGAFATTLTTTGATNVTLPTTGTLVNTAVTALSSLATVGTLTSGALGTGFTTVAVAQGGTGVATLTGLAKGNGTSAFTAAVAGTDYLSPDSTIDGGTF